MDATTYLGLGAAAKGVKIPNTWGGDWSNADAAQIRKWENECESKFNTDAEVKNCIAQKMSGDTTGKINWGNIGTSAQQFISGVLAGRQESGQTYTNDNYTPPKSTTGTGTYVMIGLGVVAAGLAIWYFGFRKK